MHKKGKLVLLAACTIAVICYAITSVTANSFLLSHTPLSVFRMEQQSSENNFLPTPAVGFNYVAEGKYNLNHGSGGCQCSFDAKFFSPYTCNTCDEEMCMEPTVCYGTCSTCCSTCSSTCVNTCHTCVSTCPYTCSATC